MIPQAGDPNNVKWVVEVEASNYQNVPNLCKSSPIQLWVIVVLPSLGMAHKYPAGTTVEMVI